MIKDFKCTKKKTVQYICTSIMFMLSLWIYLNLERTMTQQDRSLPKHYFIPSYVPVCPEYVLIDANDTVPSYQKYYDIKHVTDINCIAANIFSTYRLVHHRSVFRLGDVIPVVIDLFDSYGRHLNTGGDVLRIWMVDKSKDANINGHVTDHGNGTYTGYVRALWTGKPSIKVSIANTKEQIGAIMGYIQKYGLLDNFFLSFVKEHISEKTRCSTKLYFDLYKQTCNLTGENNGISFYCGQPMKHGLSCQDRKFVSSEPFKNKLNSSFKRMLSFHRHMLLKPIINVTVTGDREILQFEKNPCHKRRRKDTWQEESPIGFYYNNTWHNRHCSNMLNISLQSYQKCLRGYKILLFGDSNLRSWFNGFVDILTLKIKTRNYIKGKKWKGFLKAESETLNVTLLWTPHDLPYYGYVQNISDIKSIYWYFNHTLPTKKMIFVIHLYLHMSRATPQTFREHVIHAKRSILWLFKRVPKARVFIKGSHSFTYSSIVIPIDYIRKFQEKIIYEEFQDLHDKVVYLNEWDLTTGNENVNTHPPDKVVRDMYNSNLNSETLFGIDIDLENE